MIGRLFRHRLLGYITQQEQRLDEYLWKLEERDLVYEERAVPELEYSFRHVLTQETAYNTILSRRRKEFHRKVAEGYEALYSSRIEECYEELAYHYSRSDDKEKALDYLMKAGDKSRQSFANEEALEFYRKALKYTTGRRIKAKIYRFIALIHQRGVYQSKRELDTAQEYLNLAIAELGDDTKCVEMASIYGALSWNAFHRGEYNKARDIALRGLQIMEDTEHYSQIWDLRYYLSVLYTYHLGDLDKAYEYAQRGLEAAKESGQIQGIGITSLMLGRVHMMRGEYDAAEKLWKDAIEIARKIGDMLHLGIGYQALSAMYQMQEDWDRAIEYLGHCLEIPGHPQRAWYLYSLAYTYMRKGDSEKAIECSKEALESVEIVRSTTASMLLAIMEESLALTDRWEEFIPYCEKLREEQAQAPGELKLNQWYLGPTEVSELFSQTPFVDDFDGPELRSEWEWVNPKGDSSYSLSREKNWLEMQAASGNVLWDTNYNAPRLLQEISGDFAVEVKMKKASDSLPLVGGLLVWVDKDNLIRFEKGHLLENDMRVTARVQGEYDCFGRGRIASEITYLRLERIEDIFSAYCSEDGENWLTCGQVTFRAEDPIKVGIYALGGVWQGNNTDVDAAARFGSFRVLRKASQI